MAKTKAEVMPLDLFIAEHEKAAQGGGLVVTKLTHPDAEERIFPGIYAGIPVAKGEPAAIYSDGSKH
jgi:hypothetical protein